MLMVDPITLWPNPTNGGSDSESSDSGSDTTSDGTRIFVASAFGIDIVDLDAETQEVFVDGYETPYGLIVAQDHLWFGDAQSSLVSIDALSGDVQGTVALPGQFSGLAVDEDMAWANAGLIGADAQLVDGSTDPLLAIAKLDISTGAVLDLFEIGGSAWDGEVVLEAAFDHLWATEGLEGVLIKLDPGTGDELDRVDVGSGAAGIPYQILVTSDAIWVVNSTDSQTLSFDPDTLEFESGINLPYFAGAFAFVP